MKEQRTRRVFQATDAQGNVLAVEHFKRPGDPYWRMRTTVETKGATIPEALRIGDRVYRLGSRREESAI